MLEEKIPGNTLRNPLRKGLKIILEDYVVSRSHQTLNAGHYLWRIAQKLQKEFQNLSSVKLRPNLIVRWSLGQGAWARIPWFALLDQRETKVTSGGVYTIYLFRQDMSGVYLTLNQGITKEKKLRGLKGSRDFVRQRANAHRRLCEGLASKGFSLSDDIDLHSDGSLGFDYQLGTMTHKFYDSVNIPDDTVLVGDLENILQVYDAFLLEKLRGANS
jgi:hypothetical protein